MLCHELLGQLWALLEVVHGQAHVLQELGDGGIGGPAESVRLSGRRSSVGGCRLEPAGTGDGTSGVWRSGAGVLAFVG